MIGHQQIIAARQAGSKPAAIFIELGMPTKPAKPSGSDVPTRRLHAALYDPESALDAELLPTVFIAPDERPDVRFAIGCNVAASGTAWSERLIALGHALADAGAKFVVVSAMSDSDDMMIFSNGEWAV